MHKVLQVLKEEMADVDFPVYLLMAEITALLVKAVMHNTAAVALAVAV